MTFKRNSLFILILLMLPWAWVQAAVYKQHGYALYGQPRYTADFEHLDYVNPDAPEGGTLRVMGSGPSIPSILTH